MRLDADVVADMVRVTERSKGCDREGCLETWENEADVQLMWTMLYADDAGGLSRYISPTQMMTALVRVCAARGLRVSEAKAEAMCVCGRRGRLGWDVRGASAAR